MVGDVNHVHPLPEGNGRLQLQYLMLTSCRKSEILTLRWTVVDLEAAEIHLGDAKTGPRAVQLPPTAVGLLEALPRRKVTGELNRREPL